MRHLVLFLFFIPAASICQVGSSTDDDPYKMEITKNILRAMCTFTMEVSTEFTICYEHEIKRPFTLVLKTGPSLFTGDPSSDDGVGLTATASGELRYYYNLNRRKKLKKTIRNFSATYFSLEPFIKSKYLIIAKGPGVESLTKNSGAYVNIGFQKQFKRFYLNTYFGIRSPGKIYSNSVDVLDIIHGGITIGHVF
jgi:hypothetical protein